MGDLLMTDPALSVRLVDQETRYGDFGRHPSDLVAARADGVYLWDIQGNRYMDLVCAQGAVSQGHNHTRIAAAMVEQCLRLCLPDGIFRNDRLPPLLEKLCTLSGFDKALLLNSGSEAVEAAILAARGWGREHKGIAPGESEILLFTGHFHGRISSLPGTGGTASALPGFRIAPFGDLAAARAAVGPATCAVLVEPIQGESGIGVPPKGFLAGLRELCDRERLALIVDEVQSGLGRTGKWFAFQHEAIRPEGAILGNALSGGFYPVSALLGSRELLDALAPGARRSTFGGNPLACSVAAAALDVLVEEKLVDRSAELGAYFLERLRHMASPRVRDIRGLGLWAGIELRPEAGDAAAVCEALRQEGLLCRETGGRTLHLVPPLVITREQLDWALAKLKLVLEA
jgi:ornithine--oxo-acid transaminase